MWSDGWSRWGAEEEGSSTPPHERSDAQPAALPSAPDGLDEAIEPQPLTLASRPLRVLVVDDEDAVRRVVVRSLQRRGHRVDEAAEGNLV